MIEGSIKKIDIPDSCLYNVEKQGDDAETLSPCFLLFISVNLRVGSSSFVYVYDIG